MNNRIIKYRFFFKDTNEIRSDFDGWSENIGINEMFEYCDKNNVVPLQFTGLHDKEGKEIYEGDLVAEINKIEDLEKWGDPLVVEFGEFVGNKDSWGLPDCTTGFFLRYQDGETTGLHNRESAYGFESKEILVIGNIYSNPELISNTLKQNAAKERGER